MLKYLVILLDDTSTAYCHYEVGIRIPKLIAIDDLAKAITFGMKENLRIQVVYPDFSIPREYKDLINSIDHINIKPACKAGTDDIAVGELSDFSQKVQSTNVVLRTFFSELSDNIKRITNLVFEKERVNIVITDIPSLSNEDTGSYRAFLKHLVSSMLQRCKAGERVPQLNILTDRLILTAMNNCNAGEETITVAPDGKFYVCPAFYYGDKFDCGSVSDGISIKNPQLYKVDHAPICRDCDAWHCRRCVWLNSEKTLEVNTPGHIQCVISHLERNASRELLAGLREMGEFLTGTEIPEITYLDPFEKI